MKIDSNSNRILLQLIRESNIDILYEINSFFNRHAYLHAVACTFMCTSGAISFLGIKYPSIYNYKLARLFNAIDIPVMAAIAGLTIGYAAYHAIRRLIIKHKIKNYLKNNSNLYISNIMFHNVMSGDISTIQQLIAYPGFDINFIDDYIYYIISMYGTDKFLVQVFKLLCKHKQFDTNKILTYNEYTGTLLYLACYFGRCDIVGILLEVPGINVDT